MILLQVRRPPSSSCSIITAMIALSLLSYALSCGLIIGFVDAFAPSPCWVGRKVWLTPRSGYTTVLDASNEKDEQSAATIRAALYQSPTLSSHTPENPLAVLTQVADSLRVASMHGVDIVLYPELFLSGISSKRAMDRESYELNIIGNVCGELGIACLIGYSESVHDSELKGTNGDDNGKARAYNSIAAFHADGSRAGNYKSIAAAYNNAEQEFRKGHPFVESIPAVLKLPNRETTSDQDGQREIKVGMMCGKDVLSPEHCRHLVRSGAQVLIALTSFRNNEYDLRMIKCVVPSRAMENKVPFLYANPEQQQKDNGGDSLDFVGSSAIISKDGDYLVCAPQEEGGDMPCDSGYFMPCEVGALYAADLDLASKSAPYSSVQKLIEQWDLSPCIPNEVREQLNKRKSREKQQTHGFGQSSRRKGSKANK